MEAQRYTTTGPHHVGPGYTEAMPWVVVGPQLNKAFAELGAAMDACEAANLAYAAEQAARNAHVAAPFASIINRATPDVLPFDVDALRRAGL